MFMVVEEGMMTLMSASSFMAPPVVAGVGDGVDAHGACELEGLDAVFGVAGGGDGEQDVALVGEGFDLALEDVVVGVVVADGGEDGGVGGEGDGAQGGAIDGEAGDEFGDEVLGVGGRAAVAADHELAAGLHGLCGELAGLDDGGVDGCRRRAPFAWCRWTAGAA